MLVDTSLNGFIEIQSDFYSFIRFFIDSVGFHKYSEDFCSFRQILAIQLEFYSMQFNRIIKTKVNKYDIFKSMNVSFYILCIPF